MWNLFDTRQDSAGFRLNYMQVYNWGTFDDKVYTISPETHSSLLTGANGSGKTTLVDALLTLLVPSNKRFYNQSSGAESRKERTEESYVEGHYGRTQDENSVSSKISKLRPDRSDLYSIILCSFTSSDKTAVTIFQVRYFKNNALQREYIIANREIRIEQDIHFDSKGEWRKKLKAGGRVHFFDSFSQYSQKLIDDFGMKSEKALNLFNQTVGIKVLGNLDEFIRTNMLEESDIEGEFKSLLENYQNLLTAHRSIEKSKRQLELLEPIYNNYFQYETLYQEIRNVDSKIETLRPWFRIKLQKQYQEEIAQFDIELQSLQAQKGDIENKRTALEKEIVALNVAREQDPTATQLKDIERAIDDLNKELEVRRTGSSKYNKLATDAGLPKDPSEKSFYGNQKSIEEGRKKSFKIKRDLEERLLAIRQETADKQKAFDNIKEDIEYLQMRKDKITGVSAHIRSRIVAYLGATEDEVPFVGELMEVQKEEHEWEAAIEKLLNSFAKCLVVPEKYYRQVNKFVNSNDLGGKIVYHRVDPNQGYLRNMIEVDDKAVINKLNFNPQSDYSDWAEDFVARNFNYLCADSLEEFGRLDKAITKAGLTKNYKRHEKDDSPYRKGTSSYVLGWNNHDKVIALQRDGNALNKELEKLEDKLHDLQRRYEVEDEALDTLRRLEEYTNYAQINWKEVAQKISEKETERKELLKGNDNLKLIEKKLQQKHSEKTELNTSIEALIADIALTGQKRNNLSEQVRQINVFLQAFSNVDLPKEFARYEALIQELEGSTDSITALERNTLDKFKQEKEAFEKQHHTLFDSISKAMDAYLRPSAELREKFPEWLAETSNLKASPEYLRDFVDLYRQIKEEKIADFEKRFKNELNNSVIKDLSSFQNRLYEQESSIKDSIQNINRSLKKIRFNINPDTYIQLQSNFTKAPEVGEFRKRLKEWVPDIKRMGAGDMAYLEQHFTDVISPFIEELQREDAWRKRVTDVRNWLEFKATEHYAEDDRVFNVYESSGSLSGGQAAQLTYTILGSAIAHQFGINQPGSSRSFRFIAVDEAFSKLDPEKSKYLMELCQQLQLQLMVVTPLDKIHVVENYVSVIHYVENKNKRNSEVIDMSIMEFKGRKKATA